jgi:glycosyltransferase 2 family protein
VGALRLLLAAAILSAIARIVDWRGIGFALLEARPDLLLLATLLFIAGNTVIVERWRRLLVPVGVQARSSQLFRSYLKGHFIAHFVSAAMLADVVKGVDLSMARMAGVASQGMEVAASIFVERAFGAATVGAAVLLGFMLSPFALPGAGPGTALAITSGLLLACCGLALYADKFIARISPRLLLPFPRISALLLRAHSSLSMYRDQPRALVVALLLSVLIQALRILPVYLVALAVGAGADFFPYLIAVPLIFLVNTLPVLGSRIGTEQGMFVLLLGPAGVAPESALAIALVSLLLGLVVALPGGYWLLASRRS